MVNKVLFSLSVILIFITSTIVIAEEQTTIKTEYSQIALFNRDGLLYSDSGIRYSRRTGFCGDGIISTREECEPPNDNNIISNQGLKVICKQILIDAPSNKFNVSKNDLDLENPICDSDCLCNAKLKPKQAARPANATPSCGNNRVEAGEECDSPTNEHITNSAQKSSCTDRLRDADWTGTGYNVNNLDIDNPVCLTGCACGAYEKGTTTSGPTVEGCTDAEEARIRAEIQKIISKISSAGPKSEKRKELCGKQEMYKDMIYRLISQSKCHNIDGGQYYNQINNLCADFPLTGGTAGQNPTGLKKAGGVIVDGVKQILPWKWFRKGIKKLGVGGCGLIMSAPTCAYPGDDCIVQEFGDIVGGPVTLGGGIVEGLIRGVKGKCNDQCECISKKGVFLGMALLSEENTSNIAT